MNTEHKVNSSMGRPPGAGVINLDIPRINDCRLILGWSQADLAKQSGITKRALEKIFAKGKASIGSHALLLQAIQTALAKHQERTQCSVNIPDTLAIDQDAVSPPPIFLEDGHTSQVIVDLECQPIRLSLEGDLSQITFEQIEAIKKQMESIIGREPQDPMGYSEGSVRITFNLRPEEAERLLWAVKAGELQASGVYDAELVTVEDNPDEYITDQDDLAEFVPSKDFKSLDKATLSNLIAKIESGRPNEQVVALKRIQEYADGGAEALPAICKILESGGNIQRIEAANTIAGIGICTWEVAHALLVALADSNWHVRATSAKAGSRTW